MTGLSDENENAELSVPQADVPHSGSPPKTSLGWDSCSDEFRSLHEDFLGPDSGDKVAWALSSERPVRKKKGRKWREEENI